MEWPKFWLFYNFARKNTKKSGLFILSDAIASVYKYNISLIDYFYFKFYDKNKVERSKWMGTGYKYEYDLVMNPLKERNILQNKIHFFESFAPFVKHAVCTIQDLELNNEKAQKVLQNPSGKIAIKDALGQCGWDVEIKEIGESNREQLLKYMKSKGFNLVEEFIVQHPDLAKLSDTGLNTIRVITQINQHNEVDFIGTVLRITVDSPVDNMAMGNIAAPIDWETGKVIGKGAYQDIRKESVDKHPITNEPLIGFQVPYWEEVLALVKKAALHNTKNKSIGWDVAVTKNGPSFVEGNHNWCKLLWQLPLGRGMKSHLEHYRPSAIQ